jgi:hypothetical protein
VQEDFYVIVDWAHRVDPWSCIPMQGVTALYLSSTHKADAAEFVRRLLDNLQTRIQGNFKQVCFQLMWLDLNLCAYMTLLRTCISI